MIDRRTIQWSVSCAAIGAVLGRVDSAAVTFTGWALVLGLAMLSFRHRSTGPAICLCLGLLRGLLSSDVPPAEPAADPISRWLQSVRSSLVETADRTWPRNEAALVSGVLLGAQGELPRAVRQDFRRTGTSHITAVSGYNVTIVVTAIAAVLRTVPLPTATRLVVTLVGVAAFVVLTGASPAVIRAGIMGSLVVVVWAAGRLGDPLHALLVAAGAMVVVEPQTAASLGFQLSVLATAGLVLLADPLAERLRFVPEILGLRSTLAATLAAIAMTQPLIVLTFGNASIVAPIVNLIVLPLIPLIMILGFLSLVIVSALPGLAPAIGWIAWAPATFVLAVVRWFSHQPFATVEIEAGWRLLTAAVVTAAVVGLMVRWRR